MGATSARRLRPRRQAGGQDLARHHGARAARARRAQGGPRGHARPVRDRADDHPRGPRAPRAELRRRAAEGVRRRRALRRRLDDRRSGRRDHARPACFRRRRSSCRSATIRQRPPAYSAVHVDGRRAYARARAGEEFELPEREVTIHECELLWQEEDRAGLRIVCSSGTYVRSLVADLGDAYTRGAAAHADRSVQRRRRRPGAGAPARRVPGLVRVGAARSRRARAARRTAVAVDAPAEITPPRRRRRRRRAGRDPARRRRRPDRARAQAAGWRRSSLS